MSAKTTAQRVREAEASHIARGERQVRLWLPDDPDTVQRFRALAAQACEDYAKLQEMLS